MQEIFEIRTCIESMANDITNIYTVESAVM